MSSRHLKGVAGAAGGRVSSCQNQSNCEVLNKTPENSRLQLVGKLGKLQWPDGPMAASCNERRKRKQNARECVKTTKHAARRPTDDWHWTINEQSTSIKADRDTRRPVSTIVCSYSSHIYLYMLYIYTCWADIYLRLRLRRELLAGPLEKKPKQPNVYQKSLSTSHWLRFFFLLFFPTLLFIIYH